MTTKEQVLEIVERLGDDASIDRVIYELELLKKLQIGLGQIERGEFFDHDEVFDELLKDDEEGPDNLVQVVKGGPQRNKKVHKPRRPKNGQGVHKTPKGMRKKA